MAETTKKAKASSKAKKEEAAKAETVKAEPVKKDSAKKKIDIAAEAARSTSTPSTAPVHIRHEDVAELAHKYWRERGHHHGQHVDDWFRAEQELRNKAS